MKRILVSIFLLLIAVPLFIWGASLIRCDVLTLRYGELFRDRYQEPMMLGDLEDFRVLSYTADTAEVYYITCHPDRVNFPKNRGGDLFRQAGRRVGTGQLGRGLVEHGKC